MGKKARKRMEKEAKRLEEESRDVAYRIWMAGMGAYGTALAEATSSLDELGEVVAKRAKKAGVSSAEMFDELVRQGESMEGEVRDRLVRDESMLNMGKEFSRIREAAADMTAKNQSRLEDRMAKMRTYMGLPGAESGTAVIDKMERLEDEVAKLAAQVKQMRKSSAQDGVEARLDKLAEAVESLAKAQKKAAKKAKKDKSGKGGEKADASEDAAPEAVPPSEAAGAAPIAVRSRKTGATAKAEGAAPASEETKEAAVDAIASQVTRLGEPEGEADDLKRISGVGPALEARLNTRGVYHFWQIAELDGDAVQNLEDELGFRGRITRDRWVEQAAEFADDADGAG